MADSAALDAIAQMAVADLFGDTPEGKQAHEAYQQTGRIPSAHANESAKILNKKDAAPGVTVVKPLDYTVLTKTVSESKVVEALLQDDYKEKAAAIDQVANEAKDEAAKEIAKILRSLR